MFWFYFQSTHFDSLLWRNNGGVLLRGFSPRQAMRVLVALTVYSGHKVLQGTAVQGESSRSLALLVLLHGLQHHLLLKEGKLPSLKCKSLQLSVACARRPSHAWRHTWLSPRRVQTCNHMCTCDRPVTPRITHGHLEQRHAAPAHRFGEALCTRHVLQIHKGVGEELGKGDPGIWVSLQQPQQKVSAVLGDPGPWRQLIHKT